MEQLLHYCWKHKFFPLHPLRTTDGQVVEVINPGRPNTDAGPDFLDAKVKIGDILWAGSVEMHLRTSDWHRHHHDGNPAYENIILHVVGIVDEELHYPGGEAIPQLQLDVPEYISDNYEHLLRADTQPRCQNILGDLPPLVIHSWMSALQVERLELRTRQIMERRQLLDKNWEDTLFVTIARSFGFGKNGDAFEQWAYSIPMNAVGKHRDNLLQIEAFFFGQAGLLDEEPPVADDYFLKLQHEYRFLRQKFSLTPIDRSVWKFLRLRPQNFPHIRIAQLATMYYEGRVNLSRLLNATTLEELKPLLYTHVSPYWQTHYAFGSVPSAPTKKWLSDASIELLLINAVAPVLFCNGRYRDDETAVQRSLQLLESLRPENNVIIRNWAAAGVQCKNAADTQALLHLNTAYCMKHDCLRCRFGYEYIRQTPNFLRENELSVKK